MLPTDFASSRSKYPELAPIFDQLEAWNRQHQHLPFFDVATFRRLHPEVDLARLLVVLEALVEDGILSERVAVVAPTNYALALDEEGYQTGVYESEEEVPDQLYDTALTPFDADRGEFVPVYTGASGG
jgi:hypothetical protein